MKQEGDGFAEKKPPEFNGAIEAGNALWLDWEILVFKSFCGELHSALRFGRGFAKRIGFENADIDEATTLQKLREMTIARAGRMR